VTTYNAHFRRFPAALCAALLGCAALLPAAAQQPAEAETIEEVLVSGERAGPGLWKVRKGDHTLYLLATLSPLPKKMEWRSREVEDVLARAQRFVPARFDVDADIGPISGMRLYLQYRRLRGNADDQTLEQVLPPELFARFEAQRLKYAPRNRSILKQRPVVAASELWREGISRSGLTLRNDVDRAVAKLARERKVKVITPAVKIEDAKGTLAEVGQIPLDAEIACMSALLGRIESDLATARRRAEDWAVGDVEALRSRRGAQRQEACWEALLTSPKLAAVLRDFDAAWLRTVTQSLEQHPVTLAVVPFGELYAPGGVLATFRARGYEIDEP
jgi:uncharacterized protein YbaP (TraB family)